jgi:endonuclease III
MAYVTRSDTVSALLELHGRTYADEIGVDVGGNTPSPLFRLLCASLLFSARISSSIAVAAAKALADRGWTTPEKMADSTWSERAKALNESGYARYDERTSRMLGETTELLLDRYRGDLRRLRDEAERDPEQERRLLKEFKGIGDVGVDIFFREVQGAWGELYPFADRRALDVAEALELGSDPETLADLVPRKDYPRFVAALIRFGLEGDDDTLRRAAASKRELYERAKELEISGRSTMTKQELADAIAGKED